MPDMNVVKALAEGQARESVRAQGAALEALEDLIYQAQRIREQVLAGQAPPSSTWTLAGKAARAQHEIDMMRAATRIADSLSDALRIDPEPEGTPLGIVPTGQPFRFAGKPSVYRIDAWGGTENRIVDVELATRVGVDSWRNTGIRRFSTDLIVYPVQEG